MRRLSFPLLLFLLACQGQGEDAVVSTSSAALGRSSPAPQVAPQLVGAGPARERARTFVQWASASTLADGSTMRARLQGARGDGEAVAALAEHAVNAADHGQALVAVALLGEMRSPLAEPHLRRIASLPLPADRPHEDGENTERDAAEMLQEKAVDGLAYLGSASADAEVLRLAGSHTSRAVRAEAIEAYLYNHGGSAAARAALLAAVQPADRVYVDRLRHVPGETAEQFDARLSDYLAHHPEAAAPAPKKRQEAPR